MVELGVLPNITCLGSDRKGTWMRSPGCLSHAFPLTSHCLVLAIREHGRNSSYFSFAFIVATSNKNARQLVREIEEL